MFYQHIEETKAVETDSGGHSHKKNTDGSGCGWDKNQVIRIDGNDVPVVEINVPEHTRQYTCAITSASEYTYYCKLKKLNKNKIITIIIL